jgi:hypothetical protein
MRDTRYATEIASAESNHCRIERIHVKSHGRDEIRFSWWPNGRMANRPLDLPEDELLALVEQALSNGVFSGDFLRRLIRLLANQAEFPVKRASTI